MIAHVSREAIMRWFVGIIIAILVLLGVGYWLISAPDIPAATLEAKYATPPSRFVALSYLSALPGAAVSAAPTARAHYRIRGAADAPVLLLLHGSNASLFTWEPWSKALSDHFRVVSVDLPGHGLTGPTANHDYTQAGMANFVLALADKLGLKRFALAGNSMGGGVAARFAEEHPERVAALILVDAAGMPSGQGDHTPIAFTLLRQPWARTLLSGLNPKPLVREGLNDAIVRKAVLTPQMIDLYSDMARREGSRDATAERFTESAAEDHAYVKAHTAALTMPTLILWGQEDHLIPVAAAHLWNKTLPGSKLVIYPATGHIPMEERAAETATEVRAFLTAHSR
jgi:pimeloyl-ACP methyl ester carboxylesterase